jgi:putative hemolysin
VLGELVPKRLGLGNPEGIAILVAKPMLALSIVAGPVVRFLSSSTDLLLRLLRFKPAKEATVTEDEVKVLMIEGLRAGAFKQAESDMVQSVLDLDQVTVRDIMTPRPKVIWLNRDDSHETVWHKIVVSGHSCFPVYEDSRDRTVGVVSVKAIYARKAKKGELDSAGRDG